MKKIILLFLLVGCTKEVPTFYPVEKEVLQNFNYTYYSNVDGLVPRPGVVSIQRYGALTSWSKFAVEKFYPGITLYWAQNSTPLTGQRLRRPDYIIWGRVGDPVVTGDPQYGVKNPRNRIEAYESVYHFLRQEFIPFPDSTRYIWYSELFWLGDTSDARNQLVKNDNQNVVVTITGTGVIRVSD